MTTLFGGGAPKGAGAPPPPLPPPTAPTMADSTVQGAGQRQRLDPAMGGTNATGGAGLTTPFSSAKKSLLGS
jgi:hypothetical protein